MSLYKACRGLLVEVLLANTRLTGLFEQKLMAALI